MEELKDLRIDEFTLSAITVQAVGVQARLPVPFTPSAS
jgi:hypothetical protein